jgi:hypothetical protein
MKALHRRLALAALAAPLVALPPVVMAQNAPAEQNATAPQTQPMGDATISGTVAEVFGTKFILDTSSGRTLVETGPAHRSGIEVRNGEQLTVTGTRKPDNTFDAFMVRNSDGREIVVRETGRGGPQGTGRADRGPVASGERPLPPHERPRGGSRGGLDRAEIERIVAAEGYGRIEEIDRKRRHYEVEAQDRNGNEVEIHIDFEGRITRIELDEPTYGTDRLREIVEAAGYQWRGDVDRKGKHYEVDAVNPHGEDVELHVDFSGEIYKEKRDFR